MVEDVMTADRLGTDSPFPEQRRDKRTRLVYRLVRIELDGDEGLACCRNISDSGTKLELAMPVHLGDTVKVEFSSNFVFVGRVVWTHGRECGVAFESRIDSSAVLRGSAAETRTAERGPRLKSGVKAKVRVDGSTQDTVVSDLCQHGMKLTHDGGLCSDLRVSVVLGSGTIRQGVVRWSSGSIADLVLIEPLSVSELGSVSALVSR